MPAADPAPRHSRSSAAAGTRASAPRRPARLSTCCIRRTRLTIAAPPIRDAHRASRVPSRARFLDTPAATIPGSRSLIRRILLGKSDEPNAAPEGRPDRGRRATGRRRRAIRPDLQRADAGRTCHARRAGQAAGRHPQPVPAVGPARPRPDAALRDRQQQRERGRRALRRSRRRFGELRHRPADPRESRPGAHQRRRLEALPAQHPAPAAHRPSRLHAAPPDGRPLRADAQARRGHARARRAPDRALRGRILVPALQRSAAAPLRDRLGRAVDRAAPQRHRRRDALRRFAAGRRAEQLDRQRAARHGPAGGVARPAERQARAPRQRHGGAARRAAGTHRPRGQPRGGPARARRRAGPGRLGPAGARQHRAATTARRHRDPRRLPALDHAPGREHRGLRPDRPLLRGADAVLADAGRRRPDPGHAGGGRAALPASRHARRPGAQLQARRHAAQADRPDERLQAQPPAPAPVRRRGLAHRDPRPARADGSGLAALPRSERDAVPAAAARLGAGQPLGRRLPAPRRIRLVAALRGRALRRRDPRDRHAGPRARRGAVDGGALPAAPRARPRARGQRIPAGRSAGHLEHAVGAVLRSPQLSQTPARPAR